MITYTTPHPPFQVEYLIYQDAIPLDIYRRHPGPNDIPVVPPTKVPSRLTTVHTGRPQLPSQKSAKTTAAKVTGPRKDASSGVPPEPRARDVASNGVNM